MCACMQLCSAATLPWTTDFLLSLFLPPSSLQLQQMLHTVQVPSTCPDQQNRTTLCLYSSTFSLWRYIVKACSSSSEMLGRATFVLCQLQSWLLCLYILFLEECSIIRQEFQRDTCTTTTACTALEKVKLGVSAKIGRPAQHLC